MSAWWGHVPFAQAFVAALRPRLVVELGTQHGVSFCAFCEAMLLESIPGRCAAVDTWTGDRQAGFYDDAVFHDLEAFVRDRYGGSADLVRSTFDAALPAFEDGSIDLLHIDGLHTYAAARHDFENWRPKLSKSGVVMFHDTQVRESDFGVWQLWDEVRARYPTFEFVHDHGLGIAGIGPQIPDALRDLCALDPDGAERLRTRFGQIGARWVAVEQAERARQARDGLAAQSHRAASELRSRIAELETERDRFAASASEHGARVAALEAEIDARASLSAEEAARIAALEAERDGFADLSAGQFHHIAKLESTISEAALFIDDLQREAERRRHPVRSLAEWLRSRRPGDQRSRHAPESETDLVAASGLFDGTAYAGNREAAAMGLAPIAHYLAHGEAAGLVPSWSFDPVFYRERHPDVGTGDLGSLLHYVRFGSQEGRVARPMAADLACPTTRLRPDRETIVVAVHDASRTGAPITGWNLVQEFEARYNVVALLRKPGPLATAFADTASATLVLPDGMLDHPAELQALARRVMRVYAPGYLIANSAETRDLVPAFEQAGVPTVALVHEFSASVWPRGVMAGLFRDASEIVFPARIVAEAALVDVPELAARNYRILPQGLGRPPLSPGAPKGAGIGRLAELPGRDGSVVVLGVGTVTPRKGVEFFVAAAARVAASRPGRNVVFAWAGHGHAFDEWYRDTLDEQVARSGLAGSVLFLGELDDPAPAYDRADIFFLSSRLDPLPNVAIEAAFRGIPVVCFDRASGMAEILAEGEETRSLVVPYLDAAAAADRIVALIDDPAHHAASAAAMRAVAARTFDQSRYVEAIDLLGRRAACGRSQARADAEAIRTGRTFNADLYLGRVASEAEAARALDGYLAASRRIVPRARSGTGMLLRRPLEGFHPMIYAGENPDFVEEDGEDPLAHDTRTGRPEGRWRHEVIRPGRESPPASRLRVAVHGHFHYPELLADLLGRLRGNRSRCDLILTATSETGAEQVASILTKFGVVGARVVVTPNRGRDIGPMLTGLGREALGRYDVVAHLHGKRSPHVQASIGERWRDFLWENLVGGHHAMMDVVLAKFETDDRLGLVFPEDPHLTDWEGNRNLAERLAGRMGLDGELPNHLDFPQGTMFWARPDALARVFDLGLGWDDYPEEPVPIDGTVMHAIERLLTVSAGAAGYRYATTYVEGVLR